MCPRANLRRFLETRTTMGRRESEEFEVAVQARRPALLLVEDDQEIAGMLSEVLANPELSRQQKAELMLDIGGGHLSEEGQNLVKLLAENGRIGVLPEIAEAFEYAKAEHEGSVDVEVTTAFALKPAQEEALASALKKKLGREVRITSHEDPELIGGFRLRAGDMVIDGSVAAQLSQLAHELGI